MFKVLLCIPPDYDYDYPPLATPALCAFLKAGGVDAEQIDLNICYRDFLIGLMKGSSATQREKKLLLKTLLKKFFFENLKNRYYSDLLIRHDDELGGFLPYDNNTNSSFFFAEKLLSSKHLWRYLEDKDENTFLQFYKKENILGFLEKSDVRILGISVISPSQAIPSLTLGLLVKKYLPGVHVVIGGQWPTLYRSALLAKKELFRCFDSIIVFEGETPLYRLARALESKEEISIPNVILKESKTDFSQGHSEEDLNTLPCPDFDGLPLESYDAFEEKKAVSLTYESSRGCYWSKCAFCVDLPLPKPTYRRKHPDLVARDIKQLQKKYKIADLTVSDPSMSPRQMLEISQKIIEEKIKVAWWCFARLDPAFNSKIFETAARAGLKQINFGFESANDSICSLLDKGNKKKSSLKIMKCCHQAGIMVNMQTILGLPRETIDQALETIDFLVTNKKFICAVSFNVYYLTPSNYIYQRPEKYGIEYENGANLPFRFFVPFKNTRGMIKSKALQLQRLCEDLLRNGRKKDKKAASTGQAVSLSNDVSLDWLEFTLNKESSRIDYLQNSRTRQRLLFDEKKKGMVERIKEGREIEPVLCDFIEDALKRGFLVKKQ